MGTRDPARRRFVISVQEVNPEGADPTLDRDTMADIALNADLLNPR